MRRPVASLILAALILAASAPRSSVNVIPAAPVGEREPDHSRMTGAPHLLSEDSTVPVPTESGGTGGAPPDTISDRGRVTASGLDEEAGAGFDDRTVQGLGGSSPVDPPALTFSGIASWFCRPPTSPCTRGYPASGQYAAAGPALRGPGWRGSFVYVTHGGRSIRVRLIDTMANQTRLLDLYGSVFAFLAPLSRGVIEVQVSPAD